MNDNICIAPEQAASITVHYGLDTTNGIETEAKVVLIPDPDSFSRLNSHQLGQWKQYCEEKGKGLEEALEIFTKSLLSKAEGEAHGKSVDEFVKKWTTQLQRLTTESCSRGELSALSGGNAIEVVLSTANMTKGDSVAAITDGGEFSKEELFCFSVLNNRQGDDHPFTLALASKTHPVDAEDLHKFRKSIENHIGRCCGSDGSRGLKISRGSMATLLNEAGNGESIADEGDGILEFQQGSHHTVWAMLGANANPGRPMNSKYMITPAAEKSGLVQDSDIMEG